MKGNKKSKYALEMQRIKDLSALNRVLKKGDVENALLSNAAKDSETISDNVIDSMLEQVEGDRKNRGDIQTVERLTGQGGRSRAAKKGAARKAKSAAKPARKKVQKGKRGRR